MYYILNNIHTMSIINDINKGIFSEINNISNNINNKDTNTQHKNYIIILFTTRTRAKNYTIYNPYNNDTYTNNNNLSNI